MDYELGQTVTLLPNVMAKLAGGDHADHLELAFTEGEHRFKVEADAEAHSHEWVAGMTVRVLERMGQEQVLIGAYTLGTSHRFVPIGDSLALNNGALSRQYVRLQGGREVDMPSFPAPGLADFWVRPANPGQENAMTIHAAVKPAGKASTVFVSEHHANGPSTSYQADFVAPPTGQATKPTAQPEANPLAKPRSTELAKPGAKPGATANARTQAAPRPLQTREASFNSGWHALGDSGIQLRRVQDERLDALLVRIDSGGRHYELAATSLQSGRLNDAKSLALIDATGGTPKLVPGEDHYPNLRTFALAGGGVLTVKLATASLPDEPLWMRYDNPQRGTHAVIESAGASAASLVATGDSTAAATRLTLHPEPTANPREAPRPSDTPVDWQHRLPEWARPFQNAWRDGWSLLKQSANQAWRDYGPAVSAFVVRARAGLAPADAFKPSRLDTTRADGLTGPRHIDRRMEALEPAFRAKLQQVYDLMRTRHHYEMTLIEGRRTPARQNYLVSLGPHVTLRADSAHLKGQAADSAFVREGRVVLDADDAAGKAWLAEGYRLFGETANEVGLTWGGHWPHLRDYGHVEMRRR